MIRKIVDTLCEVIAFIWITIYVLFVHIKFVILEPKSAFREVKRLLRRK